MRKSAEDGVQYFGLRDGALGNDPGSRAEKMFRVIGSCVALAAVVLFCVGCQSSTVAPNAALPAQSSAAVDRQDSLAAPLAAAATEPDYAQAQYASPVVEASASGITPAALTAITMRDVIEWTAQGVNGEVIVWRIEHSDAVFRLTAANEVQLRDACVSNQVIHALAAAQRRGS